MSLLACCKAAAIVFYTFFVYVLFLEKLIGKYSRLATQVLSSSLVGLELLNWSTIWTRPSYST